MCNEDAKLGPKPLPYETNHTGDETIWFVDTSTTVRHGLRSEVALLPFGIMNERNKRGHPSAIRFCDSSKRTGSLLWAS